MRGRWSYGLRSRLAAERGVALVVAMGVLALVSTLTGIMITRSIGLSGTSDHDRDSKRALAAAEAGLQQATFRINRLAPTNALCVTDVVAAQTPVGCPLRTEEMGDRARYTYQVSPVLSVADQCAGLPVQTNQQGQVTIVQRCVTSVGEVNGQKRRVQARVAAFQGSPIFPLAGIIGVESVHVKNSANLQGWIGSNGLISMGNSSTVSGLELGPSAPAPTIGNSSSVGQSLHRSNTQGGFVLAPVEVGDSATVNDNARISNGLASPAVAPWDASSGVSYNASARTLTMGNSSSLTLGGGTYNLCKLSMGNSARITLAARPAGAPQGVRIFIDSPYRQGSGCSGAGNGTFTTGNSTTIGQAGGDPRNVQIYVYGWSAAQSSQPSVVELGNSAFSGAIYAPQSDIVFKNTATVGGAIAGRSVEFKNSMSFTWSAGLGEIRARTQTLFHRTAWKECPREAQVPGDPEAGC